MGSTARTQSNHYQTLAIDPAASNDQIVEAFSSQMRNARVRPDMSVARLAQLSVAYETLRDPQKRRAYDAALGLKPELTKPQPAVHLAFGGATILDRLNRVSEPPASVVPRPERSVPVQPAAESRVAGFIAASVRAPAKRMEPESARQPAPQASPESSPEPAIDPAQAFQAADFEIKPGRLSIGQAGATAGAGIIGAAVLAFALAVPSGNPDRLTSESTQAQSALTVPLPAASVAENHLAAVQPAVTKTAEARAAKDDGDRLPPAADTLSLTSTEATEEPAESRAPAQPAVALVGNDGGTAVAEPQPAQTSSDAAADAAPAVTTSAALPLPESTIARTIQRIGYGCGRVVSATGVEGSDGVFKITCSSGDTYRAAPVAGRYHFRRWGSR